MVFGSWTCVGLLRADAHGESSMLRADTTVRQLRASFRPTAAPFRRTGNGIVQLDGIAASTKPPVFTHAAARALMPGYPRCKTDEAIRALAAKGGVIGIGFIRFMIRPEPPVTVEHVVDPVEHVIRLVGPEHVGIGSDLDMAGYGSPVPKPGEPLGIAKQANFDRYTPYFAENYGVHVDGMNHPKRLFDLTEAMVRRRHSDATLRLVLGGSFIRAIEASWAS
jgi:membrane dipeptidase